MFARPSKRCVSDPRSLRRQVGRHAGWLHAFRADVSRAAAAAAAAAYPAAGCRPLPSPAYAGGAGAGGGGGVGPGAFTVRAGDSAFVIRIEPAPAGA